MIDDVIEFTGAESWRYHELCLPALTACLLDAAPEIRQAAAYGIGICGRFGGANYATFCAQAVPALLQLITSAGSRDEDNINATENGMNS